AEEQRLSQLRHLSTHYSQLHVIASKDTASYLANPINAYLLVKRLTTDWREVETLVHSDKRNIIDVLQQNETFPSAEDLSGAAEALLRLQDTYKLDTTSLANGLIEVRDMRGVKKGELGVQPPETRMALTANDCFELGRQAYVNQDYYHTVLWMQEALDRLEREDSSAHTSKVTILEYLAFSTYQRGNVRQALKLTHQLLELSPQHERAFGNVEYYQKELTQVKASKKKGDEGDVPLDEAIVESKSWSVEETEREAYEALCRGEKRLSARTESQLVCFYLNTTGIPFLRLTHIKVEESFKKPQIVVFHDFLSDSEIEVVKTLAEPKLKRATVQNSMTGNLETAKYRISKSAWLTNREHEVVHRISRRVSAVTGLDITTAEELQVVNY
ncbi:unnamed protein product, partial [Medioppia subpectinata]